MEEVYKFVAPTEIPIFNFISNQTGEDFFKPTLGVVSVWSMMIGVQKYADSKKVGLKANIFDEAPTPENYVSYIRNGLSENRPVALLNLANNTKMTYLNPETGVTKESDFLYHWVMITGIIENNQTGDVVLEVSTWGGKATLSFNELYDQWQEGSILDIFTKPGMIYFEAK